MITEQKYTDLIQPAIQLFENGIKPAVAIPFDEIDDLQGYPYVVMGNTAMIFQTDEQKDEFISRGGKGHVLCGEFLGYPPKAIQSYISKPPMEMRVLVDFHGIRFMTNKDVLSDDLEWLHQTYDIPLTLQTGITFDFYSLKRKDA
jgi:hypothetical protein